MKKTIRWIAALLFMLAVILFPDFNLSSFAAGDPMIIVSLGDSYSSGESITPFYGQNQVLDDKIKDRDWLAHRSQKGWPALLEVPGYYGKTGDHRQKTTSTADYQWYFVAAQVSQLKR